MAEVHYSTAERAELGREMHIFATESLAQRITAIRDSRKVVGRDGQPLELEGNIDGLDYYVVLYPEGSAEEDLILIEE